MRHQRHPMADHSAPSQRYEQGSSSARNTPSKPHPDCFDDLLAGALRCLSHRPLLGGYDEPRTLSYQIGLFGPKGADVRQEELQ